MIIALLFIVLAILVAFVFSALVKWYGSYAGKSAFVYSCMQWIERVASMVFVRK